MRILILTNFFPPYEIGGYEQWCSEVAICLQQRGHKIAILTSRHGIEIGHKKEREVKRLLHLESDLVHYRPLDSLIFNKKNAKRNISYLKMMIKEFKPDVLFVWGMWNLSKELLTTAEAITNLPVIYFISDYWPKDASVHLKYWSSPTLRWPFRLPKRLLAKFALRLLDKEENIKFKHSICVSKAVRDQLVNAGKPLNGAKIIHGGIKTEKFVLTPTNRFWDRRDTIINLIYVGGLGPHKGVDTCIKTMRILQSRITDGVIKLNLVGGGHPDYEAYLRELAGKNGNDQILFQGQVPHEKIPEILSHHDILLFPSIWQEPFARVPMEAMASGAVVIGTTTGGTDELLIHEENALTYQPANEVALADKIERLILDPELARRLSRAGQQTIMNSFTLEIMVDNLEAFLVETANQNLHRRDKLHQFRILDKL